MKDKDKRLLSDYKIALEAAIENGRLWTKSMKLPSKARHIRDLALKELRAEGKVVDYLDTWGGRNRRKWVIRKKADDEKS